MSKQELYDFVAKTMHGVALSRKIPAFVLWMPYDLRNDDAPAELIRAVEKYRNIHLLDGTEAVAGLTTKHVFRHGHPTGEAHRRYGELIASKLREIRAGGAM